MLQGLTAAHDGIISMRFDDTYKNILLSSSVSVHPFSAESLFAHPSDYTSIIYFICLNVYFCASVASVIQIIADSAAANHTSVLTQRHKARLLICPILILQSLFL